tara:strand:+ start:2674 stop:3300 length:627 start_codon:yes stop_codon:yes gene_type:complete
MKSLVTKIIAVVLTSLFIISCSNRDDAVFGGKHQENLKKLDEVYGYCDNPARTNIPKKGIEYKICKDKEAAAGADGIISDEFELLDLNKILDRGNGSKTIVYNQSANKELWNGSLKVLENYPIKNIDADVGYIETDWIYEENNTDNRCLIKIQVVSLELVSNGVESNILCQNKTSSGEWINDNQDYTDAEKQMILAILTEANRYKIQN